MRMQRQFPVLLLLVVSLGWTACSHGSSSGSSSSPVSPASVSTGTSSSFRLNNHTLDLAFPPRNEPLDFRNQLEARYRDGLKRSATSTFVDIEGDIVWHEEYLRYRVNGCDHATATRNVLAEVAGAAAAAVCGTATSVVFPPRNDDLDFFKQLQTTYQTTLKRTAGSTFVDPEGDAVWVQEYFRYRLNACNHTTAVASVMTEISGGAAPAVCGCAYTITPTSQTAPAAGGSFSLSMIRAAGQCAWTATADPFITLAAAAGNDPTTFTYTVAANSGGPRVGNIYFTWSGGSAVIAVNQAAPPLSASFIMYDLSAQSSPTTVCKLHGGVPGQATTCTLQSTSFTFGSNASASIVNYSWTVSYTYDTSVTLSQSGTSPTFSFNDTCGGTAAANDGPAGDLNVTLTVTDNNGNVSTAVSGQGSQPGMQMRFYTCGSTILRAR
jgi:hypothetical protein